jgi:glucosamine-6-phosphate deaminase
VLEREVCDVVGLDRARLHVPDGTGPDLATLVGGAVEFEERIVALGGVDVQILGIGANGHLGFNEPGSALLSRSRVKRLSDRTRADNARFFASPDDVPTHCVTQGLGTILAARRLVLVATGAAKADVVAQALEGPLSASCPASVLQWHAEAVVVLDEAAASGLRNRPYYDASARGLGLPV